MKSLRGALALGATLAALASTAQAGSRADYTVLVAGHAGGALSVAVDDAGVRHTTYAYVDRGRGPDTRTDVTVDARLLPTRVTVGGVDYLKTQVDERFERRGEKIEWTSAADAGATAAAGYYLPNQSTPEDFAGLARALLKAPGGELDLIPGGRARIETPKSAAPHGGATLYLLHGLDFRPIPVWLDASGELVFQGDASQSTVRKGSESLAAELIAAQDAVLAAQASAQAKALARRPAGPVVIEHAALFDAETRALRPNTTVVVRGDRIEAVGPDGKVAVPAGAEIVDARGKTLIPGLFDMHVHLGSDADGTLDLINGVTSVRDLGNDMKVLLERRARFADGRLVGPRVMLGGVVEGPGPLHAPTDVLVSTPEQAQAAVDVYAAHGYDQIKIYSSVDPALVPTIVARAHGHGLRVSGHVPAGMTMSEAVTDGYDEVQHANFWFLNFMGPEVNAKSNGMGRFVEVAKHGAELDLNSPEVARFVALLKEHHTVVDPTLVVYEGMFVGRPRQISPALAAVASRLPPVVARAESGGGLARTDAERETYARALQRMHEFFKKLYDAGVRIEPGTDGMAGFELAHELETYVAAGVPAPDALYLVTLGSAKIMKRDDLGVIAPGKLADLVLVEGDPTRNIGAVRDTTWVMKGGTIFDPDALARSVGVKPRQ